MYSKTYKNVPAAALVHGCFAHRRQSDQMTFSEQMSEFMMKNDPKINTITVRIEPFLNLHGNGEESATLDDTLLHSDYALNAFYKG